MINLVDIDDTDPIMSVPCGHRTPTSSSSDAECNGADDGCVGKAEEHSLVLVLVVICVGVGGCFLVSLLLFLPLLLLLLLRQSWA